MKKILRRLSKYFSEANQVYKLHNYFSGILSKYKTWTKKYFELFCRDTTRTVCVMQPLAHEFPLGTDQKVKIVFLDANMPDEETGFTFTYKPDPLVKSIHPEVTILRYDYELCNIKAYSHQVKAAAKAKTSKEQAKNSKNKNAFQ